MFVIGDGVFNIYNPFLRKHEIICTYYVFLVLKSYSQILLANVYVITIFTRDAVYYTNIFKGWGESGLYLHKTFFKVTSGLKANSNINFT